MTNATTNPYSWFTELAEQYARSGEEHDMTWGRQKNIRELLAQMREVFGGYDDRDATDEELVGDALFELMHFCLANKLDFAGKLKKSQDVFVWEVKLKEDTAKP